MKLHNGNIVRSPRGERGMVTSSAIYDTIDGQLVKVLFENLRRGFYAADEMEEEEEG